MVAVPVAVVQSVVPFPVEVIVLPVLHLVEMQFLFLYRLLLESFFFFCFSCCLIPVIIQSSIRPLLPLLLVHCLCMSSL